MFVVVHDGEVKRDKLSGNIVCDTMSRELFTFVEEVIVIEMVEKGVFIVPEGI